MKTSTKAVLLVGGGLGAVAVISAFRRPGVPLAEAIPKILQSPPNVTQFAAKVAAVSVATADFQRKWSQLIPALQQNHNQVPAQFVIDVIDTLIKNVSVPLARMQQQVINRLAVIGSQGVFSSSVLQAQTQSMIDAVKQVSSFADFLRGQLEIIAAQAHQARDKGGKKAMMTIALTGAGQFDFLVVQLLNAGVNAMVKLQSVSSELQSGFLGIYGDVLQELANSQLTFANALIELAKFLKDVANNVYDAVTGIAKLIDLAVKGTIIVGGGYLAYVLFTPKQNPRRRRRARRRLHA